jgi:glycosyltransferase involved in cell wall biosynthesis
MKPSVLIIIPDLGPGGAQPMNLRLAHQLQMQEWRVRLAVLFDRWRVVGEDICGGLEIVHLGKFSLRNRLLLPARLAHLAKEAEVVIGGVECAATTYGLLAARLANRPFISWTHIAFHVHQTRLGMIDRAVSRSVYRLARWVVFPSQGALESLRLALGAQPSHAVWEVIENFLPETKLEPAEAPFDPHVFSKPVVMGIGRFTEQKAFDRLIRAHARLLAKGIENHLVILGEGPLRDALEEEIRRLGVVSSVFLPGHVTDVSRWLGHATVFAMCSFYEGFSLVLLEALACGIPAVAMDCPSGPREILQDGWAGLLTPEGDDAAFQEALARLLTSTELRAQYTARGRERARHYAPERIVPRWEALLKRIIAGDAIPQQS